MPTVRDTVGGSSEDDEEYGEDKHVNNAVESTTVSGTDYGKIAKWLAGGTAVGGGIIGAAAYCMENAEDYSLSSSMDISYKLLENPDTVYDSVEAASHLL